MTGEPRLAGGLLPEPGPDAAGRVTFSSGEGPGDGHPWCVVLYAHAGCGQDGQAGLGATLVIYEPGMNYAAAVLAAGKTLPQQRAHVVPVRSAREWDGP